MIKRTVFKLISSFLLVLLITGFAVSAVSAASTTSASDYTMWRGDITHAGYLDEESPADATVLWEKLYCPAGTTGMYPGVDASPVVSNGLVYYSVWGDSKNQVNGIYCADAYTGVEKWVYKSATTRGMFAVSNGVLYTGTLGGSVIALDAMTGDKIWSTDQLASYSYVGLSGAPIIVGDSLYIVATTYSNKVYTSSLYVLDVETGRIVDTESLQSVDESGEVVGDGAIGKFASASAKPDGSMIYVAGCGGVAAYSPATQSIVWRYDTGARADKNRFVTTPVYSDGKIYFVKSDPREPNLFCLDEAGNKVWNVTSDYFGSSAPAVTSDKIVVTSKKGVAVFDKSGNILGHRDVGDTNFASPIVAKNVAYFGTYSSGMLYGVDITTADCSVVWSYTFPRVESDYYAVVEGTPAISNGILYIGSENCKMYAFGVMPDIVETKNTVLDGTWSAKTKAEVCYDFGVDVNLKAPDITHGKQTVTIGTDEYDTVTVSKLVNGQWVLVDATVDEGGYLKITGDKSNAERLRAVFTGRVLGDVNGDSDVDIVDSTKVIYHIAKRVTFSKSDLFYGDINGDNEVDIMESTMLIYYIAKRVDDHYKFIN